MTLSSIERANEASHTCKHPKRQVEAKEAHISLRESGEKLGSYCVAVGRRVLSSQSTEPRIPEPSDTVRQETCSCATGVFKPHLQRISASARRCGRRSGRCRVEPHLNNVAATESLLVHDVEPRKSLRPMGSFVGHASLILGCPNLVFGRRSGPRRVEPLHRGVQMCGEAPIFAILCVVDASRLMTSHASDRR